MRILYLILFLPLKYSFRLFFSAIKTVNSRRKFLGRTIYVSNHPASFFDPLVIAGLQLPIVFFMTRADIFTKISKPFFWAFHMLPIYRQQDGGDTVAKNEKIFRKCSRILSQGRNLLIFGEGFTDDVFIRRLKPIKKGAVKIGFSTLENMNWKKNVYMAAIGCNYTNPLKMAIYDREKNIGKNLGAEGISVTRPTIFRPFPKKDGNNIKKVQKTTFKWS